MKQQIEFEPVVPLPLGEGMYRAKNDLFIMDIIITDQILIPDNGLFIVNDFGTFAQVKGKLEIDGKVFKSSAPLRKREEYAKYWNEDFLSVFFELIQHIDSGKVFDEYR
jgi:hypothetical protein